MKYKKIHIIGGPGSGKTYCSKRISKKFKIPVFDLDNIFWDNNSDTYGTKTSYEKREKKLNQILKMDKYIIEGVYYSWLIKSFKTADLIIILNNSVWVRDFRITRRFLKRKLGLVKSKKESLKDFINLVKWNHKYDKNNLKKAVTIIKSVNEKYFFFKSYNGIKKFLISGKN